MSLGAFQAQPETPDRSAMRVIAGMARSCRVLQLQWPGYSP